MGARCFRYRQEVENTTDLNECPNETAEELEWPLIFFHRCISTLFRMLKISRSHISLSIWCVLAHAHAGLYVHSG